MTVLVYRVMAARGLLFMTLRTDEKGCQDSTWLNLRSISCVYRPSGSQELLRNRHQLDENPPFVASFSQVLPTFFRLSPRCDLLALAILPQDGPSCVLEFERYWWHASSPRRANAVKDAPESIGSV